jgi:hypothetical protein
VSRIWIEPLGNTANRALQYLAAEGIRRHVPEAVIENVHLPEWGLVAPAPAPPPPRSTTTGPMRYWLDVAGFGDCLRRGVVETVMLNSYAFHLNNYPPRKDARRLLGPMPGGAAATGFGPDELVCSVRGAEILGAIHPNYLLLPPAYYQQLVMRSGLRPVFFGQLGDDPYSNSLRAAFPEAPFIQGRSPEYDFETLRRSVNIAPSVSTFAWLAAWLSAARRVYLPVAGIFSPVQQPHMLLLPLDEPAFEYTLLPFAKAVSVFGAPAKFMLFQDALAAQARQVGTEELRSIIARASALQSRLPLLTGFDEAFYLACYQDVTQMVANGSHRKEGPHSGLEHYWTIGFFEGRQPFPIDDVFYAARYPDAAMAIAEGRYASPTHHYQAVGVHLGYRPLP